MAVFETTYYILHTTVLHTDGVTQYAVWFTSRPFTLQYASIPECIARQPSATEEILKQLKAVLIPAVGLLICHFIKF